MLDAPDYGLIRMIIHGIDILIPFTLVMVLLALRRSRVDGVPALFFALPLLIALGWAALWTWWPPLASTRLLPAPAGQAGAILAVAVGFTGLLLFPGVRQFFRTARLEQLAALGPWRIVYGVGLLALGLLGGLPPAFFWSAAIGDILVGLWSLRILSRMSTVSSREILLWNIVGLVDLLHVLVLGVLHLRGFYLADAGIAPLNLLPLVGVPVFVAMHLMTLWGFAARRNALPGPAHA